MNRLSGQIEVSCLGKRDTPLVKTLAKNNDDGNEHLTELLESCFDIVDCFGTRAGIGKVIGFFQA